MTRLSPMSVCNFNEVLYYLVEVIMAEQRIGLPSYLYL